MRFAGWVLAALVAAPGAHAGRPLSTEDARTLDDRACQVESWIDRDRDATTGWLVPACNFGAGIEWQVGFARSREAGESRFSEAYAQAKKVLFTAGDDFPWSIGAVAGVTRRPLQESHRGWDNPYVTVPISVGIGDDTLLHFSPGWSHDREQRRNLTTWGAAIERGMGEGITLLAEAFGENSAKPFVRVGGRLTAIKDHLDLDLTWVTRPGGSRDERFVSLGVTWQGALLR